MPTPADTLTEANRQAQTQVSLVTAAAMLRLWPLLDPHDLEGTTARWLAVTLALIRAQRTRSASMMATYLSAYRSLEVPTAASVFFPNPSVGVMNEEQVTTSLMVLGPAALRRELVTQRDRIIENQPFGTPPPLERVVIPPDRVQTLARAAAGSAVRHARNGGRAVVDDVIKNDPKTIGHVRVTDGNPCFFCAVLASRGPVYKGDSFNESDPRFHGPGNQKVHDSCGCDLKPIYDRKSVDLTASDRYLDVWKEANRRADRSHDPAILEFRRLWSGRDPQVSAT